MVLAVTMHHVHMHATMMHMLSQSVTAHICCQRIEAVDCCKHVQLYTWSDCACLLLCSHTALMCV